MIYREATAGGRLPSRAARWLMISFAVGWGLLTILVVLQDHAIDAQRELIHQLLGDLQRNLAITAKLHRVGTPGARSTTAAPAATVPGATRNGANPPASKISPKGSQQGKAVLQSPSSQVKAPPSTKSGRNSRRAIKELPVRPPAEITDPLDKRRVSMSI